MGQLSTGIGVAVAFSIAIGLLVRRADSRRVPDMPKVNVSRQVQGIESVLRSQRDPVRCKNAMTILRRWQSDETLDDASRAQAQRLVRQFRSRYAQS